MATKINENVWGTIPENDGNVRFGNSIATTIGDNNYNPETGNIDLSISPWGIGFSNVGNTSIMYATRTGGASSTSGNRIRRLETNGSNSSNTPFALVSNYNIWNGSTTSSTTWKNIIPSQKLYGETKKSESNNYIVSDSNIDKNDYPPNCSTSTYSNSVGDMKPAVYLSYQDYKLCISAFSYVNLSTGSVTRINMTASTWNSFVSTINAMDLNNFGLINIEYYQYARRHNAGSANSWSEQEYEAIQPLNKIPVNEVFRKFYFSKDSTTNYIQLRPRCRVGQFYPEVTSWSSNGGVRFPIDGSDFGASATYHSTSGGYQGYVGIWDDTPLRKSFGAYVDGGSWSFDDISYKTECKYWQVVNSAFQEYHVNDVFSYSGTMYSAPITTITDTSYNTNAESVKALLLHEIAFFGFPFTWRPDSDSLTSSIGDNNVYVPEFDSHMITTGTYKKGVDALTLPNALWQNVFDDTVPTYDPSYNPPTPQPIIDEHDNNINNIGVYNKFPSALNFYALTLNEFLSTISALNAMFVTDTDGVEKWQVNFKGVNPSDYIVGAYATVLDIDTTLATLSGITVGAINLANIEQYAKGYKLSTLLQDTDFSCGSVAIPAYGDFRDYAPYTQLELYLPLCGTVDLDPAFFVGHEVLVKYWCDLSTMSCSAAVYRVSDEYTTLYKVVNGTIGSTVPLTSLRMGDYQNNIKSIESAMKRNEMQTWLSMAGVAEKGITAIASGGGSMIYDAGGLLSGVASVAGNMQSYSDLQYQLYHTQPAIAQTGASESQNAFCIGSMYPILFIKRAMTLPNYNPSIYGHTVGYACCINDTIGNMSGYTVATNINTEGIAATAEEIEMIKQAFSKGVIL